MRIWGVFVSSCLLLGVPMTIASAQSPSPVGRETPYGTATFSGYQDIDSVKPLKVVVDAHFADPNAISVVLDTVTALMKECEQFGPYGTEPLKVVIVSHGPELAVFAKKNYVKYKDIVDRAARFAKQGVKFEVGRTASAALGIATEDLHGFVTQVPSGTYALAYWAAKGYTLNARGQYRVAAVPSIKPLGPGEDNSKKSP
jgi:intracellular sulfur oxidation DsrE/DsrF family protein